MKMIFVCKECNAIAEEDKAQSTENFTVYKTKCEKCGGQTVPRIN